MAATHFADRLFETTAHKNSILCVGMDPRWDMLPPFLVPARWDRDTAAQAYRVFGEAVLGEVAPYAAAVKFQSACYESLGAPGLAVLEEAIGLCRELGLMIIMDVKRTDIASTAEMYAQAYLGGGPFSTGLEADALTITPYLGRDGLEPFVQQAEANGRGVFVVVRSSNPSAGDVQDLPTDRGPVFHRVAEMVRTMAADHRGEKGYSCVGAVVGATQPQDVEELRWQMPGIPFLIPGVGAQGGRVRDLAPAMDQHGRGALVVAARSIIYAWKQPGENHRDFAAAAAKAASGLQEELKTLVKA